MAEPSWPEPNLVLLNNAVGQFEWKGGQITAGNWREVVRQRLAGVSWEEAVRDARPFIERTAEAELSTERNVMRLLGAGGQEPTLAILSDLEAEDPVE